MLITNNKILIYKALLNYLKFKVPTCNVSSIKIKRAFNTEQKVDLDIRTNRNKIGEIVNRSQDLNTLLFHNLNRDNNYNYSEIYHNICKLAVMSGLEIDRAKKEFIIDNKIELNKLKGIWERKDKGKVIYPYFFKKISQIKGYALDDKKAYVYHDSTMDYLQEIVNHYIAKSRRKRGEPKPMFIPFYQILKTESYNVHNYSRQQVVQVIKRIKEYNSTKKHIISSVDIAGNKIEMITKEKERLYNFIGNIKFSNNTIIYLLKMFDSDKYKQFYLTIFYILFGYPNSSFYKVIQNSQETLPKLVENAHGNILIHTKKYMFLTENSDSNDHS